MFVLLKFLLKKSKFSHSVLGLFLNSLRHLEPTSSESPEITRAQSCFRRKAFSSRWASPRLVTWGKRWQLRKGLLHWGEKTNKQTSLRGSKSNTDRQHTELFRAHSQINKNSGDRKLGQNNKNILGLLLENSCDLSRIRGPEQVLREGYVGVTH